jgi:hypothetical protein
LTGYFLFFKKKAPPAVNATAAAIVAAYMTREGKGAGLLFGVWVGSGSVDEGEADGKELSVGWLVGDGVGTGVG